MLSRLARRGALIALISIILFFILANPSPRSAIAQGQSPTPDFKTLCKAVLSRALTLTESGCAQTGRNEACYGYTKVHSALQPGIDAESNRFSFSGDILPVRKLSSIRTDPLNTIDGTWGMAVLKLQADLPDTNPGQNVTFIVFGDTELKPDSSSTKAFYLSTTLGELSCNEIPQNALLVRAPGHVAVNFTVNGVEITAASIVVLRSPPGKLLARVLEGHVKVKAQGVTQSLMAGQELTVPMKDDQTPDGPPGKPVPFQREFSLEPSVNLLDSLDNTSDKYQGFVSLSGPIEAINPLIPSLTMYGRIVLLDKVTGWEGLQVGQMVRVDGETLGFMIQARTISEGTNLIKIKPSATATSQPTKAADSQVSSSTSNQSTAVQGPSEPAVTPPPPPPTPTPKTKTKGDGSDGRSKPGGSSESSDEEDD